MHTPSNDPEWDDFVQAHTGTTLGTSDALLGAGTSDDAFTPEGGWKAPQGAFDPYGGQSVYEKPAKPQKGRHKAAQRPLDETPHMVLRDGVSWRSVLSSPLVLGTVVAVVPTVFITGLVNAIADSDSGILAGCVTAGLSLVSFGLDGYGMTHGAQPKTLAVLTGCGLVTADLVMIGASGDWKIDLAGWLLMAASTAGAWAYGTHKTSEKRAKNRKIHADADATRYKAQLAEAKADTERSRQELIAAQIARATAVECTPDLRGASDEETMLRVAFWDGLRTELAYCRVEKSVSGWVATIGLPVTTARGAARAGWDKVASALSSQGKFLLDNGQATNELVIRYVAEFNPATDTLWHEGREGIGVCTVTGEIVDIPVEGAHSMTGGRTNMGKSAAARVQLMRTVRDPKRVGVVIDPKRAEAVAWSGKLRTAGEAADPDERNEQIYDMLCELMAEFRHRQTLFPGLYWEASEEYPTMYITLDEGAALKRMASIEKIDDEGKKYKPYADALDIAETLYGEARVVGMWFNWASQYLAKGTSIPQLVKENVGAVIGLTTAGPEGDRMLFGEEAGRSGWSPSTACCGVPGRALVKFGDREPFPVQIWHVTGKHIEALPDVEPWRSRAYRKPGQRTGGMSPADKVAVFLSDNPGASDRVVAEATGVSRTTVQRLRKEL